MVRRTKSEAEETRNRLLDAAEHIFQAKGVSRTSLADIAKAAGCTRGAVYWHFENKAALFNAMMDRVVLPTEGGLRCDTRDASVDPLAHLRANAHEVFVKTSRDQQACRVFEIATRKVEHVDDMTCVQSRELLGNDSCVANIEHSVRAAIKRGLLPHGSNARSLAIGLHAMVVGLIHNWMLDQSSFDLVREGDRLIDSYLNGLKAGEPKAIPGRAAAKSKVSSAVAR